jgi:hypothetical protein
MRGLFATAICTLAMLGTAAGAQPYGQGNGDGRWDNRPGGGGGGGNWETIGQKTVDSRSDRDHLRVRGNDRYRKLRICSVDRPIELTSLSVEFHNGERQQFPVRMIVRRGDCTPSFDLDGRRRNMDDVWLGYTKLRRGGEPRILIQAR